MQDKYLKISDLNDYIKSVFDENPYLKKVYLRGEVSNFKNHTRGHLYFTLKDDTSRISAVMFYSSAVSLKFVPEDGMNVLVEGRISCYPAQGTYQIYVDKMEPDGLGNLYIEFEKLKEKLAKEGLFNDDIKKAIPKIPKRIGIITAPTGAAIRDIISTIKRRFPICETILFPALVQGRDAAPDIVKQIKEADSGNYDLDVLIVGRGGGSIEDLWAFNEEIVARAIYEARVPIISAVGHEIDFTIADFVADLRAPTPTGAAEMAVPTVAEINNIINNYEIRLNEFIGNMIHKDKLLLERITGSYILKNPLSLYEIKEQKLDNFIDTLNNNIRKRLENGNLVLKGIKSSYVLKNPMSLFEIKKEKLIFNEKCLYSDIKNIIIKNDHNYKMLINTLKLVNPLGILEKGYSLVTKDNVLIKDCKNLKKDDILNIRLHEGNVIAKVQNINNN
ncbi:MAG: exodeoxyribonuclease VII large subunit [Bacilli bacterium]|jgi:exodeoxyribonuclease VII large subunit|nr:exodeoxyribonuclease VII large subunit [Bacilli bacterium]MCX4253970.1 exodeoxyribonuclease VII large subunit [Bacilli bacterium]